jgi:hypothetical protein
MPKPVLWLFGLWTIWFFLSALLIDRPLIRWVARRWFHGEIGPPRQIRPGIYAHERGIIRLKDDTSRLQWKTCALTLIYLAWITAVNVFMLLVVIVPLASWLAEHF